MIVEAASHFHDAAAGNGTNGTTTSPITAPAIMTRPNDARRSSSDLMMAFHVACSSAEHSTSIVTTGVSAIATRSCEVTGGVAPGRDLAQRRRLVPAPPLHQRATRGIGTARTVRFDGRRCGCGAAPGAAAAGDQAGNLILERLRIGMARRGQHRTCGPGPDDGGAVHPR